MMNASYWYALQQLLNHYVAVIRMTWRHRHDAVAVSRHAEDAEFLPAVLELQHRAVTPLPRMLAGILIVMIVFVVLWSILGKVDIIAVAEGKIIPLEGAKLVQPLATATVKAIHVKDGQQVNEGDVLVELDDATAVAELARIGNEISTRRAAIAKAEALLQAVADRQAPTVAEFFNLADSIWRDAQNLATADYFALMSKLESLDADIARRDAERTSTHALIQTLEQTAPIARRRALALRDLAKDSYVSRAAYLEKESFRIEQEGNLRTQRNRLKETEALLRHARTEKETLQREFRQSNLEQISENRRLLLALEQEHIKAREAVRFTRLLAPASGSIQQVSVHTAGGVVTPAQQLMIVVPHQSRLRIDAYLRNQDIGFVRVGQHAEVKLSAFPFTRHGVLTGTVESVSADAIHDEKRGLLYAVRVSLDRSHIDIDGALVNLGPGLESKVEIRTGERRIIEYFIDPLLRYGSEAIRER